MKSGRACSGTQTCKAGAGPERSSGSKAHLFAVNKGLCTQTDRTQTTERHGMPRSSSHTKANHTEHTEACVPAVSLSKPR